MSGNRAVNFLGNFWEISESFLETVSVGTFLVFFRIFPWHCVRGYVSPFYLIMWVMKGRAHESPKKFWKNSHFENMRADFLRRCQNSLRQTSPEMMHFQAWFLFQLRFCHCFWSNWDLDTLSTSKWPSRSQFCEIFLYSWRKNGQKWSRNGHLWVKKFQIVFPKLKKKAKRVLHLCFWSFKI